ncbi:unnamed protein product [Chrysodeixis includens]|uniref:Uncharacterized protein n=1 Tax=Chrysodeixis includens TaxID=689277 RepID=A0A9N8KU67_CHRIL|nr:unnamed protein product [Chrysodeixis includens]
MVSSLVSFWVRRRSALERWARAARGCATAAWERGVVVVGAAGISGKKAKKLRVHSIESDGEEYNESFVSAGAERSGGVARWRRAVRARRRHPPPPLRLARPRRAPPAPISLCTYSFYWALCHARPQSRYGRRVN